MKGRTKNIKTDGKSGKYDDITLSNMLLKILQENRNNVTNACKNLKISQSTFYNLKNRCQYLEL